MHVDRAVAEVVASRHRHPGLAEPGQERPQHHNGGSHALHQLIGGLGDHLLGHVDGQHVVDVGNLRPHALQQIGHEGHVDDTGNVMQSEPAGGQDSGRHQLQHRVLGPGHPD